MIPENAQTIAVVTMKLNKWGTRREDYKKSSDKLQMASVLLLKIILKNEKIKKYADIKLSLTSWTSKNKHTARREEINN